MTRHASPLLALLIAACATAAVAPEVPSVKPIIDAAKETAANAALATYVARVLPGTTVDGTKVTTAVLKDARAFDEGHHHETWNLTVEIDGVRLAKFALKIFPNAAQAEANAAQFRAAVAHEWPVPTEYARGAAEPYSTKPSLLMEFLSGGTLRTQVKRQFEREGQPDTAAIAAAYGAVGSALGALHKAHIRPRKAGAQGADRSGAEPLKAMIARCETELWCGVDAKARLGFLASSIDSGPVTFVHGDLYEQQVILTSATASAAPGVAGFIDLDHAGFSDPASDVGQLLAHILLLNPRTRQASWSVPNPTPEETRETAESFLSAYRAAAELTADTEWQELLKRSRGHMWNRFGHVLADLRGNPHAAALVQIIETDKTAIAASDPFADFKLDL
jgi:aminoglycoside phosphotransferase (APT) family kinase protein